MRSQHESNSQKNFFDYYFCLPLINILKYFTSSYSMISHQEETIHEISDLRIKKFTNVKKEKLNEDSRIFPQCNNQFLFHKSPKDPVQRFIYRMQPETYIPIHKHTGEQQWELAIIVRGAAIVLIFDESGTVIDRSVLSNKSGVCAIEIPRNTYHTISCISEDTQLFEIKFGASKPDIYTQNAPWIIHESDHLHTKMLSWYLQANIGDSVAEFYKGLLERDTILQQTSSCRN